MTRTALAGVLGRTAEACKEAIAAHVELARPDLAFQRRALFAIAALEGCAALAEPEDVDIRLAMDASSEAAGVCRTQEPTEAMITVAACLDESARACRAALGETAPDPRPWHRFVFPNADLDVLRLEGHWHVRVGVHETSNKLLDVALEEAIGRTRDLAAMTVQILAWYAHID